MTRRSKIKLISVCLALTMTLFGLALPMPTRAENTVNTTMPITFFEIVPCANGGAGEVVNISGNIHEVTSITLASSGNFHVKAHMQSQGLIGVGATTGDTYRGSFVDNFEENIAAGVELTITESVRLHAPGSGNDLNLKVLVHITVNANGDVTSNVMDVSATCK